MLSLTPQSSFSKRKRPRSSLKVQTASCLLSAAAVLTVSILPLGTTASLIGTSMLSVTPTASPASSPVVAYFGQDVQPHIANGQEQTNRSERPVVIDSTSRDVDLDQDPQQTYMDSTASYPLSAGASSFLLQVDSPNEDRSHSAPPFSTDSPALKRRTQRSRQHSDRLLVRADPAATTSDDTSLGFTVRNNIASTYTSSGATTTFPSNAPSPTMLSPTPINFPAAPTSAITLPSAFPQPFDQSLSYSLTASCVAFLARYLESEQMTGRTKGMKGSKTTVGKCGRPFGLLVSSSSRWAQMARNETLLNGLLSNICYATDVDGCSDYYASLAVDIQKNANCGGDIKSRKAVALEALYGFQNYDMLQSAACLQDTQTQAYCYVTAISTSSSPDDGYLYSLSSGIALPSTIKPTCSTCSAKLINLFTETVTTEKSYASVMQPVLTNATGIIKEACGATFAGQSITMQAHVTNGASRHTASWLGWTVPLAVAMLVAVYSSLGI